MDILVFSIICFLSHKHVAFIYATRRIGGRAGRPGIDSMENSSDGTKFEQYKASEVAGHDIYWYCLEDVESLSRMYTDSGSLTTKYATVNCPAATGRWEDRLTNYKWQHWLEPWWNCYH